MIAGLVKRLAREPLVHFLLAGAVLFSVFTLARGGSAQSEDDARIVVDRRTLLNYLQYRSNAFEEGTFTNLFDAMSDADRARLIDAYVGDEVLYREAEALGLGKSDYIIRQRMIDKMRYLLSDATSANDEVDEAELEAYFDANREAYAVAPSATFTHVFFDASRRGQQAAEADARAALEELNARGAGFNDAAGMGDRFPYLRNYVERTFEYVADQFGDDFAASLAQLSASDDVWQGPIASAYGEHVVLMIAKTQGRLPELDEVRDQVVKDFLRDRDDARLEDMTATLRARYDIEIGDLDPPADAGQGDGGGAGAGP